MAKRSIIIVGNMVLLAVSLILFLCLCEWTIRVISKKKDFYDIEMWKYAVDLKRPGTIPGLSHEHRPNTSAFLMGAQITINSKGLRDYEYDYIKPDSTFRILLLGDSITLGWGVPFEATYAKLLERKLNKDLTPAPYSRYEVINTGVGNYNTLDELYYLKTEGLKYRPDMVMICFFVNDAELVKVPESIGFLDTHSYLWTFLQGRMDLLWRTFTLGKDYIQFYNDLYLAGTPEREAFESSFRQILQVCRDRSIRPFVILYPELHITDDRYPFRAVHTLVGKLAAEYHTPVVDLIPVYHNRNPESLWVAPDDAHPNAKAHKLAAEAIYRALASYIRSSDHSQE